MDKQKVWPAWAKLFLVSLAMITLACEIPTDGKFEGKISGVEPEGYMRAPKVETTGQAVMLTWTPTEKATYQNISRTTKKDDGTWGNAADDWYLVGQILTEGEAFPISQVTPEGICTFYDFFTKSGTAYKYKIESGYNNFVTGSVISTESEESGEIQGVATDDIGVEGSSAVTYNPQTGYLTFDPPLKGPNPHPSAGAPKVSLEFGNGSELYTVKFYDGPRSQIDLTTVSFPAWFNTAEVPITVSYKPVYEETISIRDVLHVLVVPNYTYEFTSDTEGLINSEGYLIQGLIIPSSSAISPAMPENVSAAKIDSTEITLRWEQVVGAKGYRVYRADSKTGEYTKIGDDVSVRQYTDTGLSPSTAYWYKVAAFNDKGETASLPQEVMTSKAGETALPAPANLYITGETPSSISLAWDKVSGATSYKIYRDDGFLKTTEETFYTDENLTANTGYSYAVSAYNDSSGEEGPKASVSEQTTTTKGEETVPATAPTGISAAAQEDGSILVSWNSVSGATGYVIYFSMSSSGTFFSQTPVWTTETSYRDTDVEPGQTWYYKVLAYNDAGNGPLSSDYGYATIPSQSKTQYTVTFDAQGGSPPAPPAMTVDAGTALGSLPVAPSRDGYTFGGWWTGVGGTGTPYTASSPGVTENIILYAHWTPDVPDTPPPSGSTVSISVGLLEDMDISSQSVSLPSSQSAGQTFSVTGTYTAYQWYLDGELLKDDMSSTCTLSPNTMSVGVHELSVVTTTAADEKLSGRCRVTITH